MKTLFQYKKYNNNINVVFFGIFALNVVLY